MTENKKKLLILGTRGIPAQHGGFETFAEHLALYLQERNWDVVVYCQKEGKGKITQEKWRGIKLINIPIDQDGAFGTMLFDLKATLHSLREPGLYLVLGYNTAIFGLLYRLINRPHIINMDGIEWRRAKWGLVAKTWFYLNERFGCWLGNHLVADHPAIKSHLSTRINPNKITTIPYGSDLVSKPDSSVLEPYKLEPKHYSIVIARPEPENSILEIVQAFCQEDRQDFKLLVLGNYTPDTNNYHKAVLDSATDQVIFPGAVYSKNCLAALRYYASWYFHGHTVGGTNPALVEALGAGCPVVAHDNPFNRWVAGEEACYFNSTPDLAVKITNLIQSSEKLERMSRASRERHANVFQWDYILEQYQDLLETWIN